MRGPVACVGICRQPGTLLSILSPCLQVRDGQGRKMSKSIGNVVDPVEVISQYGTDALRFTLATGEMTLIILLPDGMCSEQALLSTSESGCPASLSSACPMADTAKMLEKILPYCACRSIPPLHIRGARVMSSHMCLCRHDGRTGPQPVLG